MSTGQQSRAVLLLPDGQRIVGQAVGARTTVVGELCFNTGLTGYQEIFTDPSYYGQVLVTTNVHIGNYGVVEAEAESAGVQISALVCKDFAAEFSRPEAHALQGYLEKHNVPGIAGVDTRRLVQYLRDRGAVNAVVSTDGTPEEDLRQRLAQHPGMEGLELATQVSTPEPYALGDGDLRVAVLDYGIKRNILDSLVQRGVRVHVFPAQTPLADLNAVAPHGYFLSNGPGDPAAMPYAVELARELIATGKPLFGICLGHQVLAQAFGLKTEKMKFGHRGINHPVKNLERDRSEITSQNHGFVVERASVEASDAVRLTHVHLNDDSVQGLRAVNKPVFSVQYHPEANPGPHDSRYLFDDFVALMR